MESPLARRQCLGSGHCCFTLILEGYSQGTKPSVRLTPRSEALYPRWSGPFTSSSLAHCLWQKVIVKHPGPMKPFGPKPKDVTDIPGPSQAKFPAGTSWRFRPRDCAPLTASAVRLCGDRVTAVKQDLYELMVARRGISANRPAHHEREHASRHQSYINTRGSPRATERGPRPEFRRCSPCDATKSSTSSPLLSVAGDPHRTDLALTSAQISTLRPCRARRTRERFPRWPEVDSEY